MDDAMDDAMGGEDGVGGVVGGDTAMPKPQLSAETEKMMNDANQYYINHDLERAWDLCKEVIRHQPGEGGREG